MKRQYVVLERPKKSTGGGFAAAPAEAGRAPRVSVDEFGPGRAAEVLRKRSVVAVAPVMPMKLIAPVAVSDGPEPLADQMAWGIRAVGADTTPFTGEGVVVAVLDTGIDATHPAFAGVDLVRKNFTQGTDEDEHGHGTHCAGTIFGRDVNGTRIGVAPGITKALIGKVLGEGGGSSDQIVQAIQWAVAGGASVISMSLGIDFPGAVKEMVDQGVPTELATSMALEEYRANVMLFERLAGLVAAQASFGHTTLLVAAAGNESRRDLKPDFEIAVSPPAVADRVVSVAALASSAAGYQVAPFSNTGARLSGPGVNIMSAKRGGGLAAMSGTSMATPHVAGIAALWWQKLDAAGQLSLDALESSLIAGASTGGLKPGFDPHAVGTGMVRAPQS